MRRALINKKFQTYGVHSVSKKTVAREANANHTPRHGASVQADAKPQGLHAAHAGPSCHGGIASVCSIKIGADCREASHELEREASQALDVVGMVHVRHVSGNH